MKKAFAVTFVALLLALAPTVMPAQGCSQCRDNITQTPPRVQAAYRQAIILLGTVAAAIFLGTLLIARSQKSHSDEG